MSTTVQHAIAARSPSGKRLAGYWAIRGRSGFTRDPDRVAVYEDPGEAREIAESIRRRYPHFTLSVVPMSLPKARRNPAPRPNHIADESIVLEGGRGHTLDTARLAAVLTDAVARGNVGVVFHARNLAPFHAKVRKGDLATVRKLVRAVEKSPDPVSRVEINPTTQAGVRMNPRKKARCNPADAFEIVGDSGIIARGLVDHRGIARYTYETGVRKLSPAVEKDLARAAEWLSRERAAVSLNAHGYIIRKESGGAGVPLPDLEDTAVVLQLFEKYRSRPGDVGPEFGLSRRVADTVWNYVRFKVGAIAAEQKGDAIGARESNLAAADFLRDIPGNLRQPRGARENPADPVESDLAELQTKLGDRFHFARYGKSNLITAIPLVGHSTDFENQQALKDAGFYINGIAGPQILVIR